MKIGIYPGTFDPITHGHTDIITRSLRVFDKVVVAVAPNPSKHPLFNLAERLDMVKLVMKDLGQVEVTAFEGLLVDYVERSGAHAIIRGLRAISDFDAKALVIGLPYGFDGEETPMSAEARRLARNFALSLEIPTS